MTGWTKTWLTVAVLLGGGASLVAAPPPHSPAILADGTHSPAILAGQTHSPANLAVTSPPPSNRPRWPGYVETAPPGYVETAPPGYVETVPPGYVETAPPGYVGAALFPGPPLRLPPTSPNAAGHNVLRLPNVQVAQAPTAPLTEALTPPPVDEAWWSAAVAEPQRRDGPAVPLTLDELAIETVRYSQQVQALRVLPEISETQIFQAAAEFDPQAFIDSRWYDRDEPVGSFLTTGGGPRLLEETQTNNIGLRQKSMTGGTVEIAQQIGLQDSNSTFFTPTNQAQTRLALSLRQPLLRGSGLAYNTSVIVLAEHATRVAADQFAEGLQDQLLEVARQYWQLYYQRALVLQMQRNLGRARTILAELESREAIDALRSQIARARAKVATREANVARAQAGVRNAEARLRSLVNSPRLASHPCLEIVPVDAPTSFHVPLDLCAARQTALQHRPEIDKLLTEIQAASVRTHVAENQLLPSLALILEGYVNGLTGQYDATRSLGNQFTEGAPSYTAGVAFDVSLGNRRAKAQMRRRQLELVQLSSQLNAATAELSAEVEISLREVDVAYTELVSRLASFEATRSEVEYLDQRWRLLPGDAQSTSFLLEDLLDAEDRLVNEEQLAAAAQVRLAISKAELKRALGTLVVQSPCPPPQPIMPSPPLDAKPVPTLAERRAPADIVSPPPAPMSTPAPNSSHPPSWPEMSATPAPTSTSAPAAGLFSAPTY